MHKAAEKLTSRDQPDPELSTDFWINAKLANAYSGAELRPVEAVVLSRHREPLSGRVLELGVGAGRVTRHLCAIATEVHGIDVSPVMVERSRAVCPEAVIVQGDLRDLSGYKDGSFDALLATFNVIDVLDHGDRERALAGFARVLVPGGLLIMSSHNRANAPHVVGPTRQLLNNVRARRMRSAVGGVVRLPRRLANRRRMRPHERVHPTYAIVNDSAHDYSILHYYISRDEQERQLAGQGFELIEALDLEANPVAGGEGQGSSPELHYVARRA
jgi:ubiquinone/menaquinone biosynthesis C-methylase UbiE